MADAGAVRREHLLLDPADGQHATLERHLARHREVGPHGLVGEERHERGDERHACARAVLRRRALGHVDVDVGAAERLGLDPVLRGVGLDPREREVDALAHHVAEAARDVHLPRPRHRQRLDEHHRASARGPREPRRDADRGVSGLRLVLVRRQVEEALDRVRGDEDPIDLPRRDPKRHLAAHAAEQTLQVSDAGLARVPVDHGAEARVVEGDQVVLQAVLPQHLRHQVRPRDVELLLARVARERDDLHSVAERPGDVVEDVSRRDEEHLRQVEREVEVVVDELRVLLGVEHLEHRGGRVPAGRIAPHLVDLVDHQHGVARRRALHALEDLPRERTHVRAPVTLDLGLVAHAADRHPHEGAADGLRDALP